MPLLVFAFARHVHWPRFEAISTWLQSGVIPPWNAIKAPSLGERSNGSQTRKASLIALRTSFQPPEDACLLCRSLSRAGGYFFWRGEKLHRCLLFFPSARNLQRRSFQVGCCVFARSSWQC
jgi:hypothetical protein